MTLEHNLIRNWLIANFTNNYVPLIVKELFIFDHLSSLETPTILIKLLNY